MLKVWPYENQNCVHNISGNATRYKKLSKKDRYSPNRLQEIAITQSHRDHETGGHCPAAECPNPFVAELRDWFGGAIFERALETWDVEAKRYGDYNAEEGYRNG